MAGLILAVREQLIVVHAFYTKRMFGVPRRWEVFFVGFLWGLLTN